MTKQEIADSLGISPDTVSIWADRFIDWLDLDSRYIYKIHDEKDCTIFGIIHKIDTLIPENFSYPERMAAIERELFNTPTAMGIRHDRTVEKARPEIERWSVIDTHGFSLKREYEWLTPLQPYIDSIADFGCWARGGDICSESFALLWTLGASLALVIEKNSEYVHNAKEWLKSTRSKHSYFEAYNIIFMESDMRDHAVSRRYTHEFDLAFCHNVLYNMQDNFDEMQTAINTMRQVVKPGGWLIAIEEKIGVKYKDKEEMTGILSIPRRIPENEPTYIGRLFDSEEWVEYDLPNAPQYSYCYRKKISAH